MTQQESSPDFRIDVVPISLATLRPYPTNPRTHSKKQIRQIADSIRRFGFTNPVLVSDDDEIIAGHGRVEAAKLLQMKSVPAVRLSHLNAVQRKAYLIADNKLALNSGWDHQLLAVELQALVDLDFGVEITGFSLAEVDLVLEEARDCRTDLRCDATDETPCLPELASATARSGDLWLLDRHRLLCGDAEVERTLTAFSRTSGQISSSPIHPTTSPSMATCVGWAAFGTASSPWAPARCRGRSSRHFCNLPSDTPP